MAKKLIIGALAAYGLLVAILVGLVVAAEPGGSAIPIVGIGAYDQPGGVAYFSGKRLDCTQPDSGVPACTIEVAGQVLSLRARRAPGGLGGECSATYGGKDWPCRVGPGKTVNTEWSVLLDEPPGLTATQMDGLRARYPIENLGETPFQVALAVLPLINAIAFAAVAWLLIPPRLRRNAPLWVANAAMLVAVWLGSAAGWLRLTSGLWD